MEFVKEKIMVYRIESFCKVNGDCTSKLASVKRWKQVTCDFKRIDELLLVTDFMLQSQKEVQSSTLLIVDGVFDPQTFPMLRQIWQYWRSAARGTSSWFGCRGVITTAQWRVNKCCRRSGTLADGVLNTGCCTTVVTTSTTCGKHLRPTATRPFRE